ncbi:dienelactone hydrolase family protein [Pseudactinotalea sp. Z1739]|uniref:dienelactone hydrolase family protein n=1 Tax=Pseudactinotalea sp. Z1739 TaxID=3413028 RepID=UPI003C7DC66E
MSTDGELFEVPTSAGAMPAYRWLPAQGQGPGVVLVQEIFGVSTYIRRRAADLAEAGFVVLVPQLYWRLPRNDLDESDPAVLEQAMSLAGQLEWADATSDTGAALSALRADPAVNGRVGLLGFCYGGGVAFQVAAEDSPDALVSYYGSALPGLLDLAESITCPSLHHFGTADAYIPMEQVALIRRAVTAAPVPAQFETYDGAGHAFDNPAPAFHHPEASALAWPRTLEFLSGHLHAT